MKEIIWTNLDFRNHFTDAYLLEIERSYIENEYADADEKKSADELQKAAGLVAIERLKQLTNGQRILVKG